MPPARTRLRSIAMSRSFAATTTGRADASIEVGDDRDGVAMVFARRFTASSANGSGAVGQAFERLGQLNREPRLLVDERHRAVLERAGEPSEIDVERPVLAVELAHVEQHHAR